MPVGKVGMGVLDTQINYLIDPLYKLSFDELKTNENNEYALEILEVTTRILHIKEKLIVLKNGFAPLFDSIAQNIENSYNTLLIAKNYFEANTKVKNIFAISK